jgi:hypothetical protein
MRKPLSPKHQRDYERLEEERKRAEGEMHEVRMVAGTRSAEYAVATRQKDEIVAKMNRLNPQPPRLA